MLLVLITRFGFHTLMTTSIKMALNKPLAAVVASFVLHSVVAFEALALLLQWRAVHLDLHAGAALAAAGGARALHAVSTPQRRALRVICLAVRQHFVRPCRHASD